MIGLPGEDEETKPLSVKRGATSRLLRSDTLILKAMRRETPTPLQFIGTKVYRCGTRMGKRELERVVLLTIDTIQD